MKQGHSDTLALLGFGAPKLEVLSLEAKPEKVPWAGTVEFEIRLRSTSKKSQSLLIDYAVHLRKADGSMRPKVFKGRQLELAPGEELTFKKRHFFREVTTRSHYPGEQRIEVQVIGQTLGSVSVDLQPKS